jgi:hypothetical protein
MSDYNDITLDIDDDGIWLIDNTDQGDMQMGHVSWRQVAIHVQKELAELKEDDTDAQVIPALKEAQERTKGMLTEVFEDDKEMSKHFVEMADKIKELEAKLQDQTRLIEQFFALLDIKEQKDDGRYFHPNIIRSSRALDAEKLEEILGKLRGYING